jgi:LAS superfamily LD-carboxypeptidase LdcB
MTTATACGFHRLHQAARASGHTIKISSGFRTLARQQYFYNCYITKRCNNGNLAARPGTSNHGIGLALDLSLTSGAYSWMRSNAQRFGFVRTVPTETWHWEYRPGAPRASYT